MVTDSDTKVVLFADDN